MASSGSVNWSSLVASFGQCVIAAEEASKNVEERLRMVEEVQQQNAEEDDNESLSQLEAATSSLVHKLIEIHSRLKAMDEEEAGEMAAAANMTNSEDPLGSPAAANVHGAVVAAVSNSDPQSQTYLSVQLLEDLVDQCKSVLNYSAPRKPRPAGIRRENDGDSSSSPGPSSCASQPSPHALAAQLLAEIGKTEMGRGICLKKKVVVDLAKVLEQQKDGSGSGQGLETTVQILRILGNLCYNCANGRDQVMQTTCLDQILSIAKDRERMQNADPGQRFPVILPGFLLNFCNETPEAVDVAGRTGFVDVVVDNVLGTQTNDAVFNTSLNFLVAVAEDEPGQQFFKKCNDFPKALDHILTHTTSPEVTETALELIRSIAEDPDLTLNLAKTPLCTTLIKHIVGRWRSREFEEHRSDACDLLVLILSHDASMKHIYTTDNGKFMQTFLGWLRKDDMQLKVAACLAIGNFACNDQHTAQLMENKTSVVLIGLLKTHQNPHSDLKLQHAVLGAIRNLAVSTARRQLLEQGLLDPCLRLCDKLSLLNAQPVIFKLLQVLRLVIDGNPDAVEKISKGKNAMIKIIEWGTAETQGLKAESARLLASLIKNGHSTKVIETIIDNGGLPHVTTMLLSSHVKMLNESLLSLAIISGSMDSETVHAQLHTDLVINGIKKCLGNPEAPSEVKANCLTFALSLLSHKTSLFRQMLIDMEFKACLKEQEETLKDMEPFRILSEKLE